MATELLKDILKEPAELQKTLAHSVGAGREALKQAAQMVSDAQNIYLTGIGSSWHAALAVGSLFEYQGIPVHVCDASELLHMIRLPEQSVVVILSRSGKSAEVVALVENAEAAGAGVIGITNTPDSRLATRADVVLQLAAGFDHNISITMYSALTLVGGLLAMTVAEKCDKRFVQELEGGLKAAAGALNAWQAQVEGSGWFERDMSTYLLARGGSLASAQETRLLWEEAAKAPACALTTGGFRHGPQEVIRDQMRIMLWLDAARMREPDLSLVSDLRHQGVKVALVGHGLPPSTADLVLETPAAPDRWQFLLDVIPGQLAAERFARLRGVDCDSFRYCPYIIDSEGGLSYAGPARRS